MLLATFVVLFLLCVPRHALKATLPQDKILKSLSFFGVDKDLGQTLIDTAEVSVQTFTPSTSCFLSPAQQKAVTEAFKDVVDLKFHFYGGYPQAERRRALFRRRSAVEVDAVVDGEAGGEGAADALEGVNVDDLVALVNVEGNFLFEKATFDDFRGAVLQALPPASRGDAAVGDVVLDGERGAQVLLCPEDCGTLCASLKQVLSVPVDVARQELSALKVRSCNIGGSG
jgi:RNA-binding protein YlmH